MQIALPSYFPNPDRDTEIRGNAYASVDAAKAWVERQLTENHVLARARGYDQEIAVLDRTPAFEWTDAWAYRDDSVVWTCHVNAIALGFIRMVEYHPGS